MSAKFTSGTIQQIAQRVAEGKIKEIQRKSAAIKNMGTQFVKKSYNSDFASPPIDTGLSQELSGLDEVKFEGLNINLLLKIGTPYAVFFTRGLGSNRKYGERNPLEKTKDRIVKGFLNIIAKS